MQRRPAAQRARPPSPSAVGSPEFVGRGAELAALERALAGAPSGAGVVLVEGEAGIGKSRLVQELLASPAAVRYPALVVSCPAFRQPRTLGPVADALRQRIYDVAALRMSPLAGALRPLFPEWAADLPPLPEPAEDASAARHRVFEALAELLDRMGLLLLVVEDVHLVDEATSEFLLYLAARRPRRISLVLTYRREDMPAGALQSRLMSGAGQLVQAGSAARGDGSLRLALGPLDVAATAELVSSMLAGQAVSAEFAQFVHDRTEGVPLAVEESVRTMGERDDLVLRGGEWVRRRLADIAVPPTIRDSVLERAGRLNTAAQAVLRGAAILAEATSEDTLAAVSGLQPGQARTGLTAALDSGLLTQDAHGLVSFRHSLAARAVYDTVPAPSRRQLHLAAGEVLERLSPPPVAELTRHFREAGEVARWRRYGEQSAELAVAAGDEATAAVVLCDLISQAGLSGRRAARLLDTIAFAAMPDPARYVADLVSALRGAVATGTMSADEEGVIRFQIGRILQMTENFEGSRAEVQRAIPLLSGDPVTAARAMTMLGWTHDYGSPARVYTRWLRRAAALAESLEPGDQLRLMVDSLTALLMLGEEEGWAEVARLPAEGANASQFRNITIGQLNAGDLALMWGRYDEARLRLGMALDLARAHQYARYRGVILMNQAHLDWATGNWTGLAERVRPLADGREEAPGRLEAVLVAGMLEVAVGSSARAEDRFRLVLAERKRRGETAYMMGPAGALAWLALRDGRVADALRATDEPIAVVAGKGIWLWAAELAPARVAALAAAGRTAEAAGLTAAFGRGLRGRDIPAARAGLSLCRALLAEASGEPLRAAALFGRAAEASLTMPRPYDALLARERQAACLLRAGRTEASMTLARQVAQQLSALGARADAQRVSETVRRHSGQDVRPAPGRPGYGDRLSPRELDVVRLLVSGGTNAEIAERLFLSPKTVARHLESAMRKLGVSSRTALAVRAVETGIVSQGAAETPGS